MPPPSPPFALERLSRTLTRYEKKMENVPLLLGIVGTFLCFLPFIASWQKHKNGQYIGPGELFGPNYNYNTTYDDYTYTSYFVTTFQGANPTARSLYHGAAFLAIPTGIDTLLDILQCTTDAIQQRDFKYFMAKVHVDPDAGAGSIIRLTHLERFLFVTGVVLQSFIAFWYDAHFTFTMEVNSMTACASGVLTTCTGTVTNATWRQSKTLPHRPPRSLSHQSSIFCKEHPPPGGHCLPCPPPFRCLCPSSFPASCTASYSLKSII